MRILDIQNLQLSHNKFYISINDLNLENDVWYIETSINLYFNFSFVVQYYNNSSKECPEFLKKIYSPQMRGSSNVVYIIQYCLFIFSQCTESIFPTDYKSLNLIIILQ